MFYVTNPDGRVVAFDLKGKSPNPRDVDARAGDNSRHLVCDGVKLKASSTHIDVVYPDERTSTVVQLVGRNQCGDEPSPLVDAFFSLGCGYIIFERTADDANEVWIAEVSTRKAQFLARGRFPHSAIADRGARRTFKKTE